MARLAKADGRCMKPFAPKLLSRVRDAAPSAVKLALQQFRGVISQLRLLADGLVALLTGRRFTTAEVICGMQGKPVRAQIREYMARVKPSDRWHSWDATPWAHPWLTAKNLKASREFEKELLATLSSQIDNIDPRTFKYAFVGNLANNMAMRAMPLRDRGFNIDIFLHPHDTHLMSQPGWELSDQVPPVGQADYGRLQEQGFVLPHIPGVYRDETDDNYSNIVIAALHTPPNKWARRSGVAAPLRQLDVLRWPDYASYAPTLRKLETYDALFAAQVPYLAYLSRRPYLAAQTGGDLWLDAARNDALGQLQRTSYGNAQAILATNPWAYANARRYGFHHVIYAPLLIDTDRYSPGAGGSTGSELRKSWQREAGGDFFALTTARMDTMWKGSQIGFEGFCRFAERSPGARLVVIGWGECKSGLVNALNERGLSDRVIVLPISGKLKLVEYLRATDCLIDQLKIGYYGATALEAMACGVPVIMRLLAEQYDALCPTGAPPIFNATTAEEVAAALEQLATTPGVLEERGRAARQWIFNNHAPGVWERTYGILLTAVAKGIPIDFSLAPLNRPLSKVELEYHAENLDNAPPFPNYVV